MNNELKTELIECLKMGLTAQMYARASIFEVADLLKEIREAIKELEAMPTEEVK